MLHIERNGEGKIAAIHQGAGPPGAEPASLLDEEVLAFLQQTGEIEVLAHMLQLSDTPIIRVLEDLVDLLVKKNLILFTDLPVQAQEKIRERKQVRRRMQTDQFMVEDVL